MRRSIAASIVLTLELTVLLQAQQPVERIIELFPPGQPINVGLPLTPFQLEWALDRIASSVQVPIGFEAVSDEEWQPKPANAKIVLTGMTVREALDLLISKDPRYAWSESNGVIHLRPANTRASILAYPVRSFAVPDTTVSDVLPQVCHLLHPNRVETGILGSGPAPGELGTRRFTAIVKNGTLLDVLDAIVTQHGAATWHVSYAPASDVLRIGRLGFATFDGWGISQGCR
jgi:hypothetical protein